METPITCHARYLDQAIWSKTLRQYLLQKTNLNQDSLILEVGCGTGAVLQSLASEMGEHCIGLDFSLPDIQFLHHNHPDLSVVAGNAYALPLKDNTLDAIVCHFLLLWLEDPLSALREMLRVTRPGGWIMVFAEPDYGGRIDHPEILAEPGALQAQSLREQGANPQSGRNLPDWFEQLGLVEISCGVMVPNGR